MCAQKKKQKQASASQAPVSPEKKGTARPYRYGLLILLAITFLLYADVRHFEFINYDDPKNIIDNIDIRDCSFQGLKKIFTAPMHREEMAPPLTIYSFALNYCVGELDPSSYHLVNLLLHLLNVFLVFLLVQKISGNGWAALFTASVLALHPSHSEAVAWVIARKEVLYAAFYLLTLMVVLRFWENRKWTYYLLALLLFVLSYYSKYAAAAFPVLYLALALLWKQRKDYLRVGLESIPFFILPVYSLLLAVSGLELFTFHDETVAPTLTSYESMMPVAAQTANFGQKLVMGGYSFTAYLLKFLFPFQQQIIYPYPDLAGEGLPVIYFAYSVITLAIIAAVVWLFYKKRTLLQGPVGFGFIFFLVPLLLLLHILPIGGRVIIADRYTYVPFIGLGLLFYYVLQWISAKWERPQILYGGMAIYIAVLAIALVQRLPDWQSSETMFSDLIEKEPGFPTAYVHLGAYYGDRLQDKRAEELFTKSAQLDSNDFTSFYNLALIQFEGKRYETALVNLRRASTIDPKSFVVYSMMGEAYMQMGDLENARLYFDSSLHINGYFSRARINLGYTLLQMKRYNEAVWHLKEGAKLAPEVTEVKDALGVTYLELKKPEEALPYFNQAIAQSPGTYVFLQHKCIALKELKHYSELLEVSEQLVRLDARSGVSYYYRGVALAGLPELNRDPCPDLMKARELGIREANAEIAANCK